MQQNDKLMLYRGQDFYSIRDWCLTHNRLFQDIFFELDDTYVWRRPPEIVSNPALYVGGASRFDNKKGGLDDSWLVASMAVLAEHPDLVQNVVPSDQSFTAQYAGIFHFHIWRLGTWYDVVIDDRLPTNKDGELVYNKSVSVNEFWTALLEKAYCKLLGENYFAADGEYPHEALQDFTGGITETIRLKDIPKNFQNFLVDSFARRSLLAVFIHSFRTSYTDDKKLGLLRDQIYSVTKALNLNIPGYGDIVLVRVRNPSGEASWTGPWSATSPEWSYVPDSKKQELGLIYQGGGEFWMSFLDFVINFQYIDMCHLSPETFIQTRTVDVSGNRPADTNLPSVSSWSLNTYRGSWVKGVSGGGKHMHKNPQIKITLSEADDDNHDGFCSVLIALLQVKESVRRFKQFLPMKFRIYKLPDPNITTLDESFFHSNNAIAEFPADHYASRVLNARLNLLPGVYCVIPHTVLDNMEGNFMLRIYTEKRTEMEGMGYRIGLSPGDVTASDIHTMETASIKVEDEQSELWLREHFDKISGADKEVDWKELKTILDITVKKNIHKSDDENCGHGHFLLDICAYIYSKVFRKSRKTNAYQTLGPDGFSYDVCRSMVALLDVDHSGKLGFNEFRHLWEEIKKWKSIYEKYSENTDGYLNSSGLKDALEATGFNFNRQTLSNIVHRYSTKDEKMSFDDFLHCTIKIKTMVKFFKSKDENNTNKVQLSMEECLDKAIYS